MTKQMSFRARIFAILLALMALASLPTMAFAQSDAITQAANLAVEAMGDYDFLELDSADEKS